MNLSTTARITALTALSATLALSACSQQSPTEDASATPATPPAAQLRSALEGMAIGDSKLKIEDFSTPDPEAQSLFELDPASCQPLLSPTFTPASQDEDHVVVAGTENGSHIVTVIRNDKGTLHKQMESIEKLFAECDSVEAKTQEASAKLSLDDAESTENTAQWNLKHKSKTFAAGAVSITDYGAVITREIAVEPATPGDPAPPAEINKQVESALAESGLPTAEG